MCGKSSNGTTPGYNTLSEIASTPVAKAPAPAAAPKTPIEELYDATEGKGYIFAGLLSDEREELRRIAHGIALEIGRARLDKSLIQDTLLGEVLANRELEVELADLRGKVFELELALDAKSEDADRFQDQMIEAERTIDALTDIDPATLGKAATLVRETIEQGNEQAIRSARSNGMSEDVAREHIANDPMQREIREGVRQIVELAVAIERANDGQPAR
jgi:hypothetical protein